ncbi:transposase and inactivated derivatives [Candidatus Brocadia sinica JPN1]|uniref:Transposase and inactivated derivatives n=1 Tax=Candidatus Brocadia sinica JPN1 TaxID=1197129 RepID=A0ABQ0JYX9_9BACT|nr:transposase and inactivated derivatives [Candidatus Brocadia sinica JPN1]
MIRGRKGKGLDKPLKRFKQFQRLMGKIALLPKMFLGKSLQ